MTLQAVYSAVLVSIFIYGIISFFFLFFISAPYGRHFRGGWGPCLKARWAWIVMEFPAFGVLPAFYLYRGAWGYAAPTLFLLLWEVHYVHRTFVYPFRLPRPDKPFPVLLVLMGLVFNAMNGFANGYCLFEDPSRYGLSWLLSVRFLLGLVLFITGFAVNLHADAVLRRLSQGAGGYRIPRGGLYRYISCPNYFGEILEWCGFAVMTWTPAGFAFAFFTFCNLAPRAITHHKWYRRTFPDYPPERRALLPLPRIPR